MSYEVTNDMIAQRAMELAKADGTVVWQNHKYIHGARKQLEGEMTANRMAKAVTSISTTAELLKADEHAARHNTLQKRSQSLIARS